MCTLTCLYASTCVGRDAVVLLRLWSQSKWSSQIQYAFTEVQVQDVKLPTVSARMLLFCSACGACGAAVELEQVERIIRETTGRPMQSKLPLTSVQLQAQSTFNLPTPCSLLMRSYSAEGEQLQCGVANSFNAILQPLRASSQCIAFLASLIMQLHGGL